MYKIHGFKRVITSLENIQKYKSQYRGLSHIRTTPGYDGVILIDVGDKFVAVLQCNLKEGMIQALDVSPTYRRQGIASSLINVANSEFNCNKLTVRKNNTGAILLYEKHGYKIYKEEGAMLYMKKEGVTIKKESSKKQTSFFNKW